MDGMVPIIISKHDIYFFDECPVMNNIYACYETRHEA
jgi:hypothetical protein